MILATLLLGVRFTERSNGASLAAFIFSAVLLAQVRYESVVFLVPVALVVIWVWARDGRAEIPWLVVAAPLLLVHVPLHQRIFDLRASAWELSSRPGFTEPFSVSYIPDNLAHALAFFFGRASDQPNSPVLSALGCLAVPFAVLGIARWRRRPGVVPPASAVTAVFVGCSNELGMAESGLAARLLGTVNSVVFGGLATFGVMGLTHWRFPEIWRLRKVGQEPGP